MEARSPARYLAPIAIVVTIAGAYLIVHHGTTQHAAANAKHQRSGRSPRSRLAGTKFYVVQSGDNLTSIASKTKIALTTLEGLNPTVDPNSLQTGQRIRLRQ